MNWKDEQIEREKTRAEYYKKVSALVSEYLNKGLPLSGMEPVEVEMKYRASLICTVYGKNCEAIVKTQFSEYALTIGQGKSEGGD